MMRQRKSWVALLAILLLFAACKGETPTAPPPGGDPGTTPPQGASITLTASSTNPNINSTVVITATVTQNGQPVPDGTAVEFTSNSTAAVFTDTGATSTIRTTTNGVATANLTSASTGTARVTATVTNVSRSIDITFKTDPPCVPPDPRCTPTDATISSVSPNLGRPAGGERVTITGTHFSAPVRVLFDIGNGQTREAFVESVSATQITVITPSVSIGAGQQLVADIILLNEAGTPNEKRVVADNAFTFRNESLTPVIYTITPNSGPIDGGTRMTIVGEGFQSPVQVFFSAAGSGVTAAEGRIITVHFDTIIVESPPARLTNPNGSGPLTGFVDVTVVNILSNTRDTESNGFRYISKMQITGATPLSGTTLGNTEVTIDGIGFDSKTQVFMGGLEARVLRVSGTQLVVRAPALPSPCTTAAVTIIVNNVDNGDTDTWGDAPNELLFSYLAVNPLIVDINPDLPQPGDDIFVFVDDPGVGPLGQGVISIGINGTFFIPDPRIITDPSTVEDFRVALPLSGFTFGTQTCTTGTLGLPGTQLAPANTTITFRNDTTGCTNSIIIPVAPPDPNTCLTGPRPVVIDPAGGGCATPADTTLAGAATTDTIEIANGLDAQDLNITGVTISGANAADFSIAPTTASGIDPGSSAVFTVTFDPNSGTVPSQRNAVATFATNGGNITVCLRSNAN